MTWFSARNISRSTVPVQPERIWSLITDPGTLASLTPLVRSIEASGSSWRWTLSGIEGLGLKVEAVFTERMEFVGDRQIVFSHDPPALGRERAGVDGVYELAPVGPDSTELHIDLTLSVDVPMPRVYRRAVESVVRSTMRSTGQRFASNLYERLDLDPKTATITEIAPPR